MNPMEGNIQKSTKTRLTETRHVKRQTYENILEQKFIQSNSFNPMSSNYNNKSNKIIKITCLDTILKKEDIKYQVVNQTS